MNTDHEVFAAGLVEFFRVRRLRLHEIVPWEAGRYTIWVEGGQVLSCCGGCWCACARVDQQTDQLLIVGTHLVRAGERRGRRATRAVAVLTLVILLLAGTVYALTLARHIGTDLRPGAWLAGSSTGSRSGGTH